MRLDPFGQSYNDEPAATWRRILSSGPLVSHDSDLGLWLIAGHENVRAVLSDAGRFSNLATLAPIGPVSSAVGAILAGLDAPPVAITADAPEHPRTRGILRALFATTEVQAQEKWGELVAARVGELVTELAQQPEADLMHFAVQLPLRVILDILGLPVDDAADVRAWTDDFAHLVWGDPGPEEQLACARSCVALWRYCTRAVTDRADTGIHGDGVVGDLLRYRDGDDTELTVAEVAALTLIVIGAGWEATAGALGHALRHALAEPERWALLARDEHYLSVHVEETLRHSPPVDGWLRLTTTDVTIDGVTIPAGSRCLVLIGTANHDAALHREPHVFDPGRDRVGQHLAFGAGPHYCIGAALARLEMVTALRTLARRLPDLVLDEDSQRSFKPSAALRQHTALSVRRQPAGRCPVAHD